MYAVRGENPTPSALDISEAVRSGDPSNFAACLPAIGREFKPSRTPDFDVPIISPAHADPGEDQVLARRQGRFFLFSFFLFLFFISDENAPAGRREPVSPSPPTALPAGGNRWFPSLPRPCRPPGTGGSPYLSVYDELDSNPGLIC